MWKRLGELNKEFSEVKKSKKDSKKLSESIVKICNVIFFCSEFVAILLVYINFFVKMSEMGFYLLPTGKLNKKTKKSRLKNFPGGYVGSFYGNLIDNVDNVLGSYFYGRVSNDYNIPAEDVQKYILAICDFVKDMQSDIDHYVTRDRINNASFRQKLDPISKNILTRQNPLELVFEDISTFDTENPIVGSLLRELDVGRRALASDHIKNAPGTPGQDYAIQNRLNRLRDVQQPTNNYNNNNNISPPPLPPALPPCP